MLSLDIIEIISKRVMVCAEQNNVELTSTIITNGRYFDAESLKTLQGYGLRSAQITLDGMLESYCKSKGASKDDFYAVINNVLHAVDKTKISIRLNIPDYELCEAIKTTDFFLSEHSLLNKINIYLAFIRDYSRKCENARQEYIDYAKALFSYLVYINSKYGDYHVKNFYPKSKVTFCGLIRSCNTCIGPNGETYRCERDFGDSSKITGDIWRGCYFSAAEFDYWSTADAPQKQKCTRCDYLPVCMGGCMSHHIIGYDGFDCAAFKQLQLKLKLLEGGVSYGNTCTGY